MKLSNPFKTKKVQPRIKAFTFRLKPEVSDKLVFLKTHMGTSKTAVLEDLIESGYATIKKSR